MMDDIRYILASMAWERAKGELLSILATSFQKDDEEYLELKELIDNFITKIENDSPLA